MACAVSTTVASAEGIELSIESSAPESLLSAFEAEGHVSIIISINVL